MKADIKQRWIEALESGEYEQGEGALLLKDIEGRARYCCLGVLCDLHRIESGSEWDTDEDGDFLYYDASGADLPMEVENWAGLSGADPRVGGEHGLVFYNDVQRSSFHEIAALIREHIPADD